MKVNIDKHGFLNISSESSLESYALSRWCADNSEYEKINMLSIDFDSSAE